jgi:hypothetical protein
VNVVLKPAKHLRGEVRLPGDKSITHRAMMISALAEGTSEIVGFSSAADPMSTLDCLRALGVEGNTTLESLLIRGRGLRKLLKPQHVLDAGNSGTTIRLLTGILAGQAFSSTITGDDALRKRPMRRVIDPLTQMGARVEATDFSIKTRRPLLAYILKDLKVASKNPGTAFFFAMPVLETLVITLFISNYAALRVSIVLVSSLMGGVFALFLPLALLTAEGKGLEYTKTLPISSGQIIVSKALVSSGAYAFVPLVLVGLAFVKPLTTFSAIFIPVFILIAVFCASVFEMKLFFRTAAKSRIGSLVNDVEKLIVGLLAILVPELMFAVAFLSSLGYGFSLLLMAGTVLAELSISAYVLGR